MWSPGVGFPAPEVRTARSRLVRVAQPCVQHGGPAAYVSAELFADELAQLHASERSLGVAAVGQLDLRVGSLAEVHLQGRGGENPLFDTCAGYCPLDVCHCVKARKERAPCPCCPATRRDVSE